MAVTRALGRKIAELWGLFSPKSIALIGVPRELKPGRIFLAALLEQGFPWQIHVINPGATDIDGFKAYPSIKAVDGPVDAAIILVPGQKTPDVLQECAEKGVKLAILYTAGYGELGTAQGRLLEQRVSQIANSSGMRLLGPNCMGIYSPRAGLANFLGLSRQAGKFAIVSQSGSLANMLSLLAPKREIYFSWVFSTGNELDLGSSEILECLGQDEDTEFIGMYLEGIRDGSRFLKTLKTVSRKKPVFVWKLGRSDEGRRAARSHTGSMTGSSDAWEAAFRQSGCIRVVGLEEFVDMATAFYFLPHGLGRRVGIVSGLPGLSAPFSSSCTEVNLEVPAVSQGARAALSSALGASPQRAGNPLDMDFSMPSSVDRFQEVVAIMADDPCIDTVMAVGEWTTPEQSEGFSRAMSEAGTKAGKCLAVVNFTASQGEVIHPFFQRGIPVFDSVERAALACSKVLQYRRRVAEQARRE